MVSMSKVDFDKAIQSAEDKLRTNYSKQIKELQDKVTELTPKEKSQSELDLEAKLKEVEDKSKEIESKERRLTLLDTLSSKGIDKSLADYLKDDIDIEKFEGAINAFVSEKTKLLGYVPTGHQNNEGVSKENWKAMSYSEKQKFYESNPTLAKKLMEN